MAEEGRVAVRNVRRDINEKIKKSQKDSKITEDQKHNLEKRVQDTTDKYTAGWVYIIACGVAATLISISFKIYYGRKEKAEIADVNV